MCPILVPLVHPCFGFLVMSPLGFKAWVGCLIHIAEANVMYIPWDPPLVLHLPTSCQPACCQSCPHILLQWWGCSAVTLVYMNRYVITSMTYGFSRSKFLMEMIHRLLKVSGRTWIVMWSQFQWTDLGSKLSMRDVKRAFPADYFCLMAVNRKQKSSTMTYDKCGLVLRLLFAETRVIRTGCGWTLVQLLRLLKTLINSLKPPLSKD